MHRLRMFGFGKQSAGRNRHGTTRESDGGQGDGEGRGGRRERRGGLRRLGRWPVTLALRGESVRVSQLPRNVGLAGKLRDMGVFEGGVVTGETPADPVVLVVLGSRIAISRRLARHMLVCPAPDGEQEEKPEGGSEAGGGGSEAPDAAAEKS